MILNLFAGAGGWDEGGKPLGLQMIGVDNDAAACLTGAAAGFTRMRSDVRELDPRRPLWGLVASPPCTDWTIAGNQLGLDGPTGSLMNEVMRFAHGGQPEWIACEQVDRALHLWQEYAVTLREWGYSTWTGVCNAWDFGVPQSRKRAFLIASRTRIVHPPLPTHPPGSLSMGKALGWTDQTLNDMAGITDGPRWYLKPSLNNARTKFRHLDELSPTLALGNDGGRGWKWTNGEATVELLVPHIAVLQGFRPDYPFSGPRQKRYRMVGETVPPPLAEAILSEATGRVRGSLDPAGTTLPPDPSDRVERTDSAGSLHAAQIERRVPGVPVGERASGERPDGLHAGTAG